MYSAAPPSSADWGFYNRFLLRFGLAPIVLGRFRLGFTEPHEKDISGEVL